jgi:hypothetical membrane protein
VQKNARALARIAIAGIAVYFAIDIALVFLRPHLSVLHNAESDYGSKGAYAWLMDVNFLLRCGLSLAAVLAIWRFERGAGAVRSGLVLLTVWAVGSGLLAFFPDDPVGTTIHGRARVHLVLAGIAFVAVIVGTRMITRAFRNELRWKPVILLLAVLSWGALVPIVLLARAHLRLHSLGGLYEKLFLAIELGWFLVASLWIARSAESAADLSGASFAEDVVDLDAGPAARPT